MSGVVEQLRKEIEQQADTQEEVEDLDIDGLKLIKFTPEMAGLFTKFPSLVSIGLADCSLTTLEGFPKIPNLENLILENNQLDGSALKYIANNFKSLVCLSMAENKIKSFDELQILSQLKNLQQLDLSENPVASIDGYHKKVFQLVPSLRVLDNKDENGVEIEYTDDDEEDIEDGLDDDDYDSNEEDDDDEEVEGGTQKKKKI